MVGGPLVRGAAACSVSVAANSTHRGFVLIISLGMLSTGGTLPRPTTGYLAVDVAPRQTLTPRIDSSLVPVKRDAPRNPSSFHLSLTNWSPRRRCMAAMEVFAGAEKRVRMARFWTFWAAARAQRWGEMSHPYSRTGRTKVM